MSNFHFQKIIFEIDYIFSQTLRHIIKKVIDQYKKIPLQWEDIYYNFLLAMPKIIFSYDEQIGIKFKTYLGLQCKFYARTYVKHYVTNQYRILNESYSFDQIFENAVLNDCIDQNDNDDQTWLIDTSSFTFEEFLIYNKRYLENKKIKQIEQETNWNYYEINNLSKKIKRKIKKQFTKNDNHDKN